MIPTIIQAALGVAAAATTAATQDASTVANAASAIPQGLHVALSHVPSASHAMEVLKQHLAVFEQAIRHGLHLGLGK